MSACWSTMHDRLVRPRPPVWARASAWVILGFVLQIGSFFFLPGGGRGRGVLFGYAIFPDGRRVLEPLVGTTTPPGASAELTFMGTIWSVEVLGFRSWRCDVSTGDRMRGPVPPTGMTAADVDALRREGCAAVIAASRGDASRWGPYDINGDVPLHEDIPAIEMMAAGGGRGCGGGLRGLIGGAMHSAQRWMFCLGMVCFGAAATLRGLHQSLRLRLQRRIDRADKSLCPGCAYPLSDPSARCPECGVDAPADARRCARALAGS